MKLLLVYLFIINATGFILMLTDKYKAQKNLWRIPESFLLWTAVLGGSFGAMIGMYAVRHKTLHLKFSIGLPLLFILQFISIVSVLKFL